MSFFSRLFGRREADADLCSRIVYYVSELKPEFRLRPAIAFGNLGKEMAAQFARSTTLTVFVVPDLETLEHLLTCQAWKDVDVSFDTLFAQSRPKHSGEAGEAIRLFRQHRGEKGKVFYGAWDYDAEKAAHRAVEYEADGILMPGIDANELYAYVFGVMKGADRKPSTADEHVALLRKYTTNELSPFWRNAARVQSENY